MRQNIIKFPNLNQNTKHTNVNNKTHNNAAQNIAHKLTVPAILIPVKLM
jgi:hypothetical protein